MLDGHIVLTRKLAEAGHYPAIDIGQSISRCMNGVTRTEHQQSARALKQNYAAYMEIKPLIPLGGYVAGADASVDKAVKMFPAIERFLRRDARTRLLELVQSRLQILFPIAKRQKGNNHATNHRHRRSCSACGINRSKTKPSSWQSKTDLRWL